MSVLKRKCCSHLPKVVLWYIVRPTDTAHLTNRINIVLLEINIVLLEHDIHLMKEPHDMSKTLISLLAIAGVITLSGCASDWIGKGKGKAPPPVEEPAPVYK